MADKLTTRQEASIERRWLAGESENSIAARFGVSWSTVHGILKRRGTLDAVEQGTLTREGDVSRHKPRPVTKVKAQELTAGQKAAATRAANRAAAEAEQAAAEKKARQLAAGKKAAATRAANKAATRPEAATVGETPISEKKAKQLAAGKKAAETRRRNREAREANGEEVVRAPQLESPKTEQRLQHIAGAVRARRGGRHVEKASEIRDWARSQGIKVGTHGRLPFDTIAAFNEANGLPQPEGKVPSRRLRQPAPKPPVSKPGLAGAILTLNESDLVEFGLLFEQIVGWYARFFLELPVARSNGSRPPAPVGRAALTPQALNFVTAITNHLRKDKPTMVTRASLEAKVREVYPNIVNFGSSDDFQAAVDYLVEFGKLKPSAGDPSTGVLGKFSVVASASKL